jgi:hypothetical protein
MLPRDYVFQNEGLQRVQAEGRVEGKVEGKAEAVLVILESRGLPPSAADRARILACTDEEALGRWLRAAISVDAVEALFGH